MFRVGGAAASSLHVRLTSRRVMLCRSGVTMEIIEGEGHGGEWICS
jgi:hypothetical protein